MTLLAPYRPLFVKRPAWRYAFITGGRGSAKSFHVATFLLNLTYEAGHVILFTRWTLVSAEISIIPEFLEKIQLLGREADFEVKDGVITNRATGSRILFRGIKTSAGNQTANLKSIHGVTTFVMDEAEEMPDEDTFDKIDLSVRHDSLPNRTIVVMNPSHRKHFMYRKFVEPRRADTLYIHTTFDDNPNLSASWLEQAHRLRETNPKRYGHIFRGEWLDDVEGLLWTPAIIERQRLRAHPDMSRIIVAVDPAITARADSDETGIVVIGKDDRNAYVLDDLSGRYTPNQWASVAVKALRDWGGSAIVAEVNQGGDMVETVIKSANPEVRVKQVRATKGKYARAEPVFALYEQGRVFHVGHHPALEEQMLSFNPGETDSPDRVDALVWGVSELITGKRAFFTGSDVPPPR